MKNHIFYFVFTIVIGIVCGSVLGEVSPAEKPFLLHSTNPELAGINELYVVVVRTVWEPNKHASIWRELEEKVETKLKEAGIKIPHPAYIGRKFKSLQIPELRIYVDMLRPENSQQYVFHIRTSLVSKVSLVEQPQRYIKTEIWKIAPVMQAAPVEGMPEAVTNAVLGQVETFINCYMIANPIGDGPVDTNNVSKVPKNQITPNVEQTVVDYKYVASKNSKVFHGSDCRWAEKISPKNLVVYNSRNEVVKAGKRPCKQCKP